MEGGCEGTVNGRESEFGLRRRVWRLKICFKGQPRKKLVPRWQILGLKIYMRGGLLPVIQIWTARCLDSFNSWHQARAGVVAIAILYYCKLLQVVNERSPATTTSPHALAFLIERSEASEIICIETGVGDISGSNVASHTFFGRQSSLDRSPGHISADLSGVEKYPNSCRCCIDK